MALIPLNHKSIRITPILVWLVLGYALVAYGQPTADTVLILAIEGKAEVAKAGSDTWRPAAVKQVLSAGDRLRTKKESRATISCRWCAIIYTVSPSCEIEIQPPQDANDKSTLNIKQGAVYLFSRGRTEDLNIRTPTATGAIRGTEFNVLVTPAGKTVLTMIDGVVELENEHGRERLISGDQGTVEPGKKPTKTAALNTVNIIQWCLYYPAVVDPGELNLDEKERAALAESLTAYRQGDLLQALDKYPVDRQLDSDAEKIYRAALLLSVGEVEQTEALLNRLSAPAPLANALQTVILATKNQRAEGRGQKAEGRGQRAEGSTASELVARSYYYQSQWQLSEALKAARAAAEKSPAFGIAQVRVAELEFGFGRNDLALAALNQGLSLSPRHAQALALKGFLLSAQNRQAQALLCFDAAIAIDGALGNAWLGRGLCKIRQGLILAGRQDLQVAAVLEPQRAILRSYLGKALDLIGDHRRAEQELELARRLDLADPTPWFYSALMRQQQNRVNAAIGDLETSLELNDNRRLYRSRMLLDQDRAVRGANLATIYEDAGMAEVSAREASRAVNSDYANYSAHLFLANSYQALRDPRQINLRYETPWLSEYLVANLLAPANAGTLSPQVSYQEYSRLFERNRLGFASSTEYSSRGEWTQSASQYGIWNGSSYAVDEGYRFLKGYRPNSDLEDNVVSLRLKQELGAKDSLFLQGIYYRAEAGDVAQYYRQQDAYPRLRVKETQEPLLMLGYHHEWAPGSHTLVLGGRWQDTLRVANPDQPLLMPYKLTPAGPVFALPWPTLPAADFSYRSDAEGYTLEAQHILKAEAHGLTLGGRLQTGVFDLLEQWGSSTPTKIANNSVTSAVALASAPLAQSFRADFQRAGIYGYYQWQVLPPLQLTAGLSYDYLNYPVNYRFAPLTDHETSTRQFGPKAGVIWTPFDRTAVRAAYTRSLGGVSFDQSFRLEPVQVAGFNQAYRSLIPEAISGANAGERFSTWGLALDQQFKSRTYLGLQGEWLNSDLAHRIGTLDMVGLPLSFMPSTTRQNLEYREKTLRLTLNQLVGNEWSLGAAYRLSQADLRATHPDLPSFSFFPADRDNTAILHQADLFALFNHRSGLFARFDSIWSQQSNRGYTPDIPGDDFWQFNIYAGYRFWRRHAELRLGLLNLSDQNYQLNPLNLTLDLPRERTLMMSLKFAF